MWTLERLRNTPEDQRPELVLFWSHRPRNPGSIDAACLSQWFPSPFQDEHGHRYITAEHWMMASKAKTFGDLETHHRILQAQDPEEAKSLGRKVRGFDSARWDAVRFDVVVKGNLAKFRQHRDLRAFLLETDPRVLVEASPVDLIWGIGFAADHPSARDPSAWRGQNLLGFALMSVRDQLLLEPPEAV